MWLVAGAVGAQPQAPSGADPSTTQKPRAPAATAPASVAPSDAAELEEIELTKTRDRRRAARRAKLEALWGDVIQKPPTLVELQLHGWRMARLRRLGRLAALSNKPLLQERITRLEIKEEARHVKQLDRLKRQAEPASAAPPPRRARPLPEPAASSVTPESAQ